jgi:hypothetical protein
MPFAKKQYKIFPAWRKVNFLLCMIACLFTLSGCIEEYEADIPDEDTSLLVVEGTIYSSTVNTFILSRTMPLKTKGTEQPVTKAKLSVRGSDGSVYYADGYKGQYFCEVGKLNPDEEYWLHIEVDDEVYETEPQHPLFTEGIAELSGVQHTPESDIEILVTTDKPANSNQTNYYSWTYFETWEVHPAHTTYLFFDIPSKSPIYMPNQFPERGWKDAADPSIIVGASTNYKDQHIKKYKVYGIKRDDERIYYRYTTLLTQRAITKAEYEYQLARRQADSEMGGLFTPLPSALPTNIHCLTSDKRVIGYVGCAMNTSECRIFLDHADYSIDRKKVDALQWYRDCSKDDCVLNASSGLYLCIWEDHSPAPEGLVTAWTYREYLDVTCQGAYIEMPPYWEE